MRVLMLITGLNKGGAEKNFSYITINTSIFGYKFEPTVVSIFGGEYTQHLLKKNIRVITLIHKNTYMTIFNIFRFITLLFFGKSRFDIIHSFLPHAGLLGAIFKIVSRKPFIYAIRNSQNSTIIGKHKIRKLIRDFCDTFATNKADCITGNSIFIVDLYRARYPCKKIVLINNAIFYETEIKNIIPSTPQGIIKNKFNVVFIANMRFPQKDVIGALKVAVCIPDVNFVFVGNGPDLQRFINFKNINCVTNSYFVGHADNVFHYLKHADLYLLLTNHEGFPNTVLEAMVAEVPVVMSDIPEVNSVLINGDNCFLVKNNDYSTIAKTILMVKNKKIDTTPIIRNAKKMVDNDFSLKSMISKNYNTYITVLTDKIIIKV